MVDCAKHSRRWLRLCVYDLRGLCSCTPSELPSAASYSEPSTTCKAHAGRLWLLLLKQTDVRVANLLPALFPFQTQETLDVTHNPLVARVSGKVVLVTKKRRITYRLELRTGWNSSRWDLLHGLWANRKNHDGEQE